MKQGARPAVARQLKAFKQFFLTLPICLSANAVNAEWTGSVGLESRFFWDNGAFQEQKDTGLSLSLETEYLHKWYDSGDHINVFTFIPFLRYDHMDEERTHVDIRQLDWLAENGNWVYQFGVSKVFWGVTESAHLVDIINQTDLVEHVDGEEKLGQPMARLSYVHEYGAFTFFVLPYFRERTFAGENGRFRPALPVSDDHVTYESSREEKHIDYALRLQQTFNEFDLGLSYFNGTSRAPDFVPDFTTMTLKQHYPQIEQVGLDLQFTGEEWLWKLEAIYRGSKQEEYNAQVGGFEYTMPRFAGTYADLGLIAEYHHDSRGDVVTAPFQDDLFLGARIALNDLGESEILVGGYLDMGNNSQYYILEYSSRIRESLKLEVDAQVLTNVEADDALNDFKKDSFIELGLVYYF